MNYISKIKRYLTDVNYRFYVNNTLGLCKKVDDETVIKRIYKVFFKYDLPLNNPQTFNEKLQWLKLYDKNPLYTTLVDKYEVKKYVSNLIGDKYIIKTYGIYDSFDDIDFNSLPNQFVMKCTHDSGGVVICKDKRIFNYKKARKVINKSLKRNYYYKWREWPYKNVKPRIIIEEYLEDNKAHSLDDYKFFCFNGKVDCVMVCIDRNIGDTKFYFFDRNWLLKRYNIRGKNAPKNFTLEKPSNLDSMFKIAEILSKDFPFVRIDLYSCDNSIYFGEYTFYPQSGYDKNLILESDNYFGSLIDIKGIKGRKL